MQNIDSFIKSKLKEKNMHIDAFIKETGMSKSSIYRIMKGYQHPSEDLLKKIASILDLDFLGQQELRYYSNLTDVDDDVLYARKEIYNFLHYSKTCKLDKIEMVYYDKEKYLRDFNEILDNLLFLSANKNFSCKFRMINCCQDSIIQPLSDIFFQLTKGDKQYSLEHLVTFSTDNSKENIQILERILPLIIYKNYTVKYCEVEGISGNSMFYDFLIIDYCYTNQSGIIKDTHLYIAFLDDLSVCYVNDEQSNIQDFFERSYTSLQYNYRFLKHNLKVDFLFECLTQLEREYDCYLFKPNPCSNRIPLSVCFSIKDRVPEEEAAKVLNSFFNSKLSLSQEEQTNMLFDYFDSQAKYSYERKQTDIFNCNGLESFAATGMFSDHLTDLPPFTPSEVKIVLEYIKARDLDKKDPYSFYLINSKDYNMDLAICIFKNYGLVIAFSNTMRNRLPNNSFPLCAIEHQGLSNAFLDFAENYVPAMLAMPQKQAYAFIDSLIEKYC